jgi:DNA segregation ATPase FtsK/SpoIIIE, S-DNA-T family
VSSYRTSTRKAGDDVSVVAFRRPARRDGLEMPAGDVTTQEPPALPDVMSGGLRGVMTIMPMMLMSAVMVLMLVSSARGPLVWLMMGLMGVAMVGMLIGQLMVSGGDRKRRVGGDRRDYMRYLGQQRKRIRASIGQQRQATAWP